MTVWQRKAQYFKPHRCERGSKGGKTAIQRLLLQPTGLSAISCSETKQDLSETRVAVDVKLIYSIDISSLKNLFLQL